MISEDSVSDFDNTSSESEKLLEFLKSKTSKQPRSLASDTQQLNELASTQAQEPTTEAATDAATDTDATTTSTNTTTTDTEAVALAASKNLEDTSATDDYVPVIGRPRLYTANQLKKKRAEYHKRWYAKQKEAKQKAAIKHREMERELQNLHRNKEIPRLVSVLHPLNSREFEDECYVCKNVDDYVAFIDKLLSFLTKKRVISGYDLSRGMNSGKAFQPIANECQLSS